MSHHRRHGDNKVKASVQIDAPPEEVWRTVLDPNRLGEWVTIHRKVNHADPGEPRKGFQMDQTLCLRHANFKVHWTLTEAERPHRATWEGKGPAGSYARTSYRLRSDGDGTHFEYENEFKAPGGFLGAAASRAIIGGVPEREANRSLSRLKSLLER
jgi:carbon monoxide dehydrogenase subunit G